MCHSQGQERPPACLAATCFSRSKIYVAGFQSPFIPNSLSALAEYKNRRCTWIDWEGLPNAVWVCVHVLYEAVVPRRVTFGEGSSVSVGEGGYTRLVCTGAPLCILDSSRDRCQ